MTGKIIKAIAGFYYIYAENGKIYATRARGVFRKDGVKPLVGDNAEFDVLSEEKAEGNLIRVLPRKNVLIRPAVANVDQALIVFAVREPDPNLNLLDRFLIYMDMQGIPSVIYFNKADLNRDGVLERYRGIYERAGYRVIGGSVKRPSGQTESETEKSGGTFSSEAECGGHSEEKANAKRAAQTECGGQEESGEASEIETVLRQVLAGKTTVLAGPSGVGKSSLTNLLHAEAAMEVGALSEKIKRGKQTTRHTELFALGGDSFLLDTPGFTSLVLPKLKAEEVRFYFDEFQPYSADCRFSGCVHAGEPEAICGVKRAASNGGIARVRYDNYLQIYQELKEQQGQY